jgi:hypothetical protein
MSSLPGVHTERLSQMPSNQQGIQPLLTPKLTKACSLSSRIGLLVSIRLHTHHHKSGHALAEKMRRDFRHVYACVPVRHEPRRLVESGLGRTHARRGHQQVAHPAPSVTGFKRKSKPGVGGNVTVAMDVIEVAISPINGANTFKVDVVRSRAGEASMTVALDATAVPRSF